MTSETPLLRLERLGFSEPTVVDVLKALKKLAKTADAKEESKIGDWRRGQAGRIRVYRDDYLELKGIVGDYEPKAGELMGYLRENKKRYDKPVYSPTFEGDIDLLVGLVLLYDVVEYE